VSLIDALRGWKTRLVDLLQLEEGLHDFEIGDKFVLVLCIHLNSRHWNIAWK
jgi:hypothetical protein